MTFPNIKTLLSIAMVLPMSTATVERSFSDRKQIKNRLHNRLQPSSLSKLMMIAIEGPQLDEVDFDAVLSLSDEFCCDAKMLNSDCFSNII